MRANRELVRNLANEIKNQLGGLRGAAQLLEADLSSPSLVEYTQVIISEADRLQDLVNKLLAPHKLPHYCLIVCCNDSAMSLAPRTPSTGDTS